MWGHRFRTMPLGSGIEKALHCCNLLAATLLTQVSRHVQPGDGSQVARGDGVSQAQKGIHAPAGRCTSFMAGRGSCRLCNGLHKAAANTAPVTCSSQPHTTAERAAHRMGRVMQRYLAEEGAQPGVACVPRGRSLPEAGSGRKSAAALLAPGWGPRASQTTHACLHGMVWKSWAGQAVAAAIAALP